MRAQERLGDAFGYVLGVTDMRTFLSHSTEPKKAYAWAKEAMDQLLQRVQRADFICLLCKQRQGTCRCVAQGCGSARYPGTWVYFNASQRWAVTYESIMALTATDLAPLAPRDRERMTAWIQHLRAKG